MRKTLVGYMPDEMSRIIMNPPFPFILYAPRQMLRGEKVGKEIS